jgi:hypothetical protein
MIQSDSNDRLVQALGADLTTVRRLPSPGLRALMWLAILGSVALALAMVSDVKAMMIRLMAAPDLWLAALASMLTAVLAAIAAFELSLPDRKAAWALLPLPALLLWISASGMGCLRAWSVAEASPMPPDQAGHCLIFILGFSLPLSLVLIAMLRRGFSSKPHGSCWRTRLRFGSCNASQLCSPLRCKALPGERDHILLGKSPRNRIERHALVHKRQLGPPAVRAEAAFRLRTGKIIEPERHD